MADAAPTYAWMNGEIIPWDQCVVHGRSAGGFMGSNVFEGVRAYWNAQQEELFVFKHQEHLQRLARSMKTARLEVPHTLREIGEGALDLLRANAFRQDAHFVPVAFFGMGAHHFNTLGPTVGNGVYITAVSWPQPEALWNGVAACVASWRRISDDSVPPRLKAGANYQNSRLAQTEATVNGYDTAIILNHRGTVAEGPGACLMMVRDGALVTPPVTAGILESITRATLMDLAARELKVTVIEREIDRTELYVADEVFMCGSGLEVLPITSLDRITIGAGARGPMTKQIQDVYFAAARGELPAYRHWLTPVYGAAREPAVAAPTRRPGPA
jgi:branched-chain amino acid aminotransferase